MTQDATAPAELTIDLGAMARNYRLLRDKTAAAVAGVIKADAYGTGAERAFQTLRAEGCTDFFVATPDEAAALRKLDNATRLFTLGGLYAGAEDFYVSNRISPVLNSLEEVSRWSDTARRHSKKLPAILHIDTGMNRLGLEAEDVPVLFDNKDLLAVLDIQCVMSHFACSDEKGHAANDAQAALFADLMRYFPQTAKSLCNSSGIFRSNSWHYDLVRPGYALYGGNPTPEESNPMEQVVSLKTRILQTRPVKKDETAGYGCSYKFEKDTTLATVALGYADGFLRAGSNKAALYWNGAPCPIRGRVSMDLVIVDLGGIAFPPQAGDWLEVLGPSQSVDDLAATTGTIGYEILTSLGSRYHRTYKAA